MKVRIGTFNAENLFARYKFKLVPIRKGRKIVDHRPQTPEELATIAKDGWAVDKTMFDSFKSVDTQITALAVKETRADILGLQEVEAMDTLKKFCAIRVLSSVYKYKVLIDANDPRFIDVALLVKKNFDIAYIRTHQFERTKNGRAYIFSRDCLEVGVQLSANTVLPIFVNHFKSMMEGRAKTMARRRLQAERVAEILKALFGPNPGKAAWVVLGDFNDYMPSSGLQPLVGQPWCVNAVDRILDPNNRWTHYWNKGKEYRQLDYILLSKALADANPQAVPEIIRRGQPKRATRYQGPWFQGVDENDHKASDHCPVVIEIDV